MAKTQPPTVALPALTLKRAFDRVRHAAATDFARPILASILIEGTEGGLRFVAADNYRIAVLEVPCEISGGPWPATVISIDDLDLVRRALAIQKTSEIRIVRADRSVTFEGPVAQLRIRLVDGTFPDFHQLLADVVADGAKPIVALNARFLADIVKGMDREGTYIATVHYAGDPLKPVLVTSDGDTYREVLMPVRTADFIPSAPPEAVSEAAARDEQAAPAEAVEVAP